MVVAVHQRSRPGFDATSRPLDEPRPERHEQELEVGVATSLHATQTATVRLRHSLKELFRRKCHEYILTTNVVIGCQLSLLV